jgi:acyl dehydratase
MAERTFTSDDQLAFAKLSGDRNPLHMDPVMARRLLFGQPIVHGLHALLWGADEHLRTRAHGLELRFPGRDRTRTDRPLHRYGYR